MGARVLSAAGWRPDCSQEQTLNIERAVPPGFDPRYPMVFGAPEASPFIPKKMAESMYTYLENTPKDQYLYVEVRVALEGGVGTLNAYCRSPTGGVLTRGWIKGLTVMDRIPTYLWESALEKALALVL